MKKKARTQAQKRDDTIVEDSGIDFNGNSRLGNKLLDQNTSQLISEEVMPANRPPGSNNNRSIQENSSFNRIGSSRLYESPDPNIPRPRKNDKISNQSLDSVILKDNEQDISNANVSQTGNTSSRFEKKGNKSTVDALNTPIKVLDGLDKTSETKMPLCINLTDMPYKLTLMIGHPLMDQKDESFRTPEGVHFIQSYIGKNTKYTPESDKNVPKESEYLICSIQQYKPDKEDPTKKNMSQVSCVYEIINNKSNGGPVFNFGSILLTKPNRTLSSVTRLPSYFTDLKKRKFS